MQEQSLARLAGQVAALEQGGDGAAARRIDRLGEVAEYAAFADGNHQGGGFYGFRASAFD